MEDGLYTVKEVSEILRVNKDTVYSLIRAGLLPAMKLGCLKIRKHSVEEFLGTYDGYDLTDLKNIVELSKD